MKLWVSKNSEVPVHDQLVAQITLGIASNDLAAGERLPSTRELARRFGVHQNTVSTAYRELASHGLVTLKKGSGVYVADASSTPAHATLNDLFAEFLENAARLGYSPTDIGEVLSNELSKKRIDRVLVVESNEELREILVAEIKAATSLETSGIALEKLRPENIDDKTKVVALADERAKLDQIVGANGCSYLDPNSVPSAMQGQDRPSEGDLIAVVSGWKQFISFARLFLLAADIDADTVITRSTSDKDWRKATAQASMIICDSLTAKQFSRDDRVRVFSLIAGDSLDTLRRSVNT